MTLLLHGGDFWKEKRKFSNRSPKQAALIPEQKYGMYVYYVIVS